MKSKSGFTLVELLVVMVVIAILASVALVTYARVQRDANDNTRKGNAAIIAEGLERYYDQNGEYPSVTALVNNTAGNTGTVVAAKLKIAVAVLDMPNMAAGATNALSSTAASQANDYINYTASRPSNEPSCQTTAAGGCDEFTLTYFDETGSTITVTSRHQV
ncbi:MAG TPA: prepilin-type N-terminal cleavage/methylation domain-containing protein [Candidatus Saccharimonadales bacterium]|nr:prepilin-type N-terminal cleavage/methylation domain-containing protein [Candidatus Saccharimonadales bacterium]